MAEPTARADSAAEGEGRLEVGPARWWRRHPAPPRRDPRLLGWLGVGLAVRLLLMPFAVSTDLLAVYWRAHLIAFDGQVYDAYLVNMGAHYVHALALRLFAPLLPAPDAVWTDPWWWADASALAPQIERSFVTADGVYATLFALKLPYLLADLGTGLLLLALVRAAAPLLRRRAFAFWMLSPIGLYATYVFGRYEAFAVLLVVAALLCCERGRPWWGAVLLGVGITMRTYPLLLVPVFALLAPGGRSAAERARRAAGWAALALAPFVLVLVTNRVIGGTVGELSRLRDYSTGATFFAYTLPVGGGGDVFVFAVFALLLYGVVGGRTLGWFGRRDGVDELWVWLALLHAGMFGLATFSAHYFMWFTPFVALALARRPRWAGVLPLHLAQVVVVLAIADLLGGPGTTWGLFSPAAPGAAEALPTLRDAVLTSPEQAEQLLGVLRSVFLAVTVLLVGPAVGELVRPRAPQPPRRERDRAGEQRQPADEPTGAIAQAP